jgi:hypothetical protein
VIDAHVHCWDTAVFGFDWLAAFPSLSRRRQLDDYPTGDGHTVTSVVLVEAGAAAAPAAEAAWLADRGSQLAPPIAGVVAARDLTFDLCVSGPTLHDAIALAAALLEVQFVLELADHTATGSLDVVLSYCRGHVLDRGILELVAVAAVNATAVVNASPLCMGLLTVEGAAAWHPADAPMHAARDRLAAWAADQNLAYHSSPCGTRCGCPA